MQSHEPKSDPKSNAKKPVEKGRALGQVLTPAFIAKRMTSRLLTDRPSRDISILDPCTGPGTFGRALHETSFLLPNDSFTAIDIDRSVLKEARQLAGAAQFKLETIFADYLELEVPSKFDYAVLNPPYIRQEWIDKKESYLNLFQDRYGLAMPGTSNLYVYFLVKTVHDLKQKGRFSCIVYDSWQSTLYGRWLAAFLDCNCSELNIETVSEQPFFDKLIDATIIYGVKAGRRVSVPTSELLKATEDTERKSPLQGIDGFCRLDSLFGTKRGLRLKQADFFLCDMGEFSDIATPFLKKVSKVTGYVVPDDHEEGALLITDGKRSPKVLVELKLRLANAKRRPDLNTSILTWYKERPKSWFVHREPPRASIVFNYYLRNRPRHIYSPDRPFSDNFYGLTVPGHLSPFACLAVLNSTASCVEILSRSRNQGSGLAKIQLFEYRSVNIPDLRQLSKREIAKLEQLGKLLIASQQSSSHDVISKIDELIASIYANENLNAERLTTALAMTNDYARKPKEHMLCLG